MPAKSKPKSRTRAVKVKRRAASASKDGRGSRVDIDLLRELSNAIAVSGDEGAVRRIVLEAIKEHVDEVRVDALGSVLAIKRASSRVRQPVRLMLAAHMDEIGLMIVDHDSDGSLRFEAVGGVNERVLPGKAVLVGPKRLAGVIGAAPVHLLTSDRRAAVVKLNQMRIDIGAGSQEAARRHVSAGDRAGFATEFQVLDGALCGKALDDRLGVATLIALLRARPYPVELHAAFTVQEEVGLRGARVAGYAINPGAAIALDCAPALDLPSSRGTENTQYNARLGAGPVIYVSDKSTISDNRLVSHLIRSAESAGLPYQIRQPGGGGTDAGAIQAARGGVPVVSLSVPARHLHSPAAIARTEDWENTLRLAERALQRFSAGTMKKL